MEVIKHTLGSGKHGPELENKQDSLVEVGVDDYNLGSYLYSRNVASCQAVILWITLSVFRQRMNFDRCYDLRV